MMFPVLLLSVAALLALVLGFESWRMTSSGKVRLNTLVGAAALGFAAYLAAHPGGAPKAAVTSFIVAMLFGGYGFGLLLRIRREPQLQRPALFMTTVGAVALLASVVTYLSL